MEHPDLTFCREALKEVPLARVAADSAFSKRWLEYIRDGQIDNPGIQRIAELKAYIRARPDLWPELAEPTQSERVA